MVGASRKRAAPLIAALILAAPMLISPPAVSQTGNRSAIVVQHGDLVMKTACVGFSEAEITSMDALERSDLTYLAAEFDLGRAICWLDGEGCESSEADECFACDPVRSWSLWVADEGDSAPQPSDMGPEGRAITNGSIDYWVWGPFGVPPVSQSSVDEVCADAAPPPPRSGDEDEEPAPAPDRIDPGVKVKGASASEPLPATL